MVASKPEYRLQTLLQLRERQKQGAERDLAACLETLRAEQERLRGLEEELRRTVAKREAKIREYSEKTMRGELDARGVAGANVYVERLRRLEEAQRSTLEGQQTIVADKENGVVCARADLADAMRELETIEKHREKWEQQVKKRQLAQQEAAMDELAQTSFLSGDD